jgi:hypothetical protein
VAPRRLKLKLELNQSAGSAAPHRASAIVKRSAKLFDEGLGRHQIRKTPAIKRLAFIQNYMTVSRLDLSRIVKVHDLTA